MITHMTSDFLMRCITHMTPDSFLNCREVNSWNLRQARGMYCWADFDDLLEYSFPREEYWYGDKILDWGLTWGWDEIPPHFFVQEEFYMTHVEGRTCPI